MVHLGAKTIPLPQFAKLESLEQAELVIRQLIDVVEELMRRHWQDVQILLSQGKMFLGTVVSSPDPATNGVYLCTVDEIVADGLTDKGSVQVQVYNEVDRFHQVKGIPVGKKILCWRVSIDGADSAVYAGVELFGRTTIGLCP